MTIRRFAILFLFLYNFYCLSRVEMSFVASSFFIISQGFSQEDVSSPSVNKVRSIFINTVKPVLRCHFWNKENVAV